MAGRLRVLIRFTVYCGMGAICSHTFCLPHVPRTEQITAYMSELLTNSCSANHNNARHTGRRNVQKVGLEPTQHFRAKGF